MNVSAETPEIRGLKRDSETYRFVFSGTYQGVLLIGDGIEDCNAAACQLLGRKREQLLGLDLVSLSPANQRNGVASADAARERVRAAHAGYVPWFEWRFRRDDGSTVDTLLNMEAVRVDGAMRLLLRMRDISYLERSEAALHGAALALSTAEGDTVFRELVRHLAGYLEIDLAFIALPSEDDPRRLRMLAFYLDGKLIEDFEYPLVGTPCETVLGQQFRIYPSGLSQLFPIDEDFKRLGVDCYAGYPLNDAHGKPLGLIAVVARKPFVSAERVESLLKIFAARAVTEIERRRADRALRASEEQYRTIFNASVDGLLLKDSGHRIVDVNQAYLAMHGYRREELVGNRLADFIPDELQQRCEVLLPRILDGEPCHIEAKTRRRDGSTFDVEIHGVPMRYRGQAHALIVMRDITESKRAEAARGELEAQLRQAQKMEAIGQLSGGIAHDFNNILASIMGYIALAADRPPVADDAKLGRHLEQAQSAVRRARDLIQQLLTFSRGQRGEPRVVALAALVHDSMQLLRSTLPATVRLDTLIAGDLPSVMLDPVHLEQVLINLCINARDAMGGGGEIRVSAKTVDTRDWTCASCRQRVQGRYVELAVADCGPGIAPEVMERMFDPFFTTKEAGKGSGMGLATVHGIVHEYGGHICVDSTITKGARFRVLLTPLGAEQDSVFAKGEASLGRSERSARLSGRVLVVEDEEMVANMLAEILVSWGVTATVMRNPVEAEQWFMQDPARVDLVLTDQIMPKLTGVELAQRLTLVRPELPVVLCSGYGAEITHDQATHSGICALIAKPVEPAALLSLLRAHLPVTELPDR